MYYGVERMKEKDGERHLHLAFDNYMHMRLAENELRKTKKQ